jgi:hypothetical protein
VTQHKYRATPTEVDGIRFASKGEANRYKDLRLMQDAGAISDLGLQPRFSLVVNGVKVGTYVADFVYREDGQEVYEDFKGMITPVYRMKKKLVLALFGVTIRETRA